MIVNSLNLSGSSHLPVIRQNEASECGLASLAMIAAYYGFKVDLSTLRRKYAAGLQGMAFKHIIDIAIKMQFSPRPIKTPLNLVAQIKLPAIIHWDMNHFVVLKKCSTNKYTIHDPALGKRDYTREEFSKHYTGIALELTPTEKFTKHEERNPLKLTDLWGKIYGLKRNLLQVFLLSIVLQIFILASPFYLQTAVDEVLTTYDTKLLLVMALGFGGVTLINVLTQTLRGYVLLYFGSMLSFQMTGNLFRHLLRLPIDFFEKRHIGDIMSRFGSMTPIKTMLTEGLIAGIIDGAMAVTTLILMIIYSPTLALIALIAWFTYLIVRLFSYSSFRSRQEGLIVAQAEEQTIFMESVRSVTSLKLFGSEENRLQLWQNRYADTINENARFQKLNICFDSARAGIFGFELVVLVYVAIKLVLAGGGFTVGMLFAFMAYKQNFTDKASALVERMIEFRMLGLHLERIADIAHTEQEADSDNYSNNIKNKPITGKIECERISFKYAFGAPEVLRNISMTINAGESVAIVGESGCGKTTLLKVMTGLFKTVSGRVLIDEIPLKEYGLAQFRQQIGVVMQDDDLFAGSIAENIAFFDSTIDIQRVISAAEIAVIHENIMAMPMKYETLLGDMGSTLSGGQKQRLMLARAMYRNPQILFLDEGTAHLDIQTENKVNQSISNLGITRIIIAHRPETIRSANRILEMRDGELRELKSSESFDLLQQQQSSKDLYPHRAHAE